MNTADPTGPNYLKPAPGYGQQSLATCQHESIVPCSTLGERAQYLCTACKTPFPESLIEERDGKLKMRDFSGYRKGPRRR